MAYSQKVVDRFEEVLRELLAEAAKFDPNDADVATGMKAHLHVVM